MTLPTAPSVDRNPSLTLWLVGEISRWVKTAEPPVALAERIVDHLTAAGRLLPDDTAARSEWATRIKAHDEYDEEMSESWANSVMTEEERARNRAHHWRRRFAPELVDVMRREVHITPWTVAEEPA